MSLFRRAPREVYRVYGEEEYLAGEPPANGEGEALAPSGAGEATEELPFALDGERFARPAYVEPPHPIRAGRLLVVAALVLVCASAVGLVALNAARHASTSARGNSPRAGRAPSVRSSSPERTPGAVHVHPRSGIAHSARPSSMPAPTSRSPSVSSTLPPTVIARLAPDPLPSDVTRAAAEFGFER